MAPTPDSGDDLPIRADHEPPRATDRWGWRFHHIGIPTDLPREGESYLAEYKLYHSGFPESAYGIEWMRFEAASPVHELVKRVPHVAFEVDDIHEALKGKTVLTPPGSPSAGVRTAVIVDDGCPIELIQFVRDERSQQQEAQDRHRDAGGPPWQWLRAVRLRMLDRLLLGTRLRAGMVVPAGEPRFVRVGSSSGLRIHDHQTVL